MLETAGLEVRVAENGAAGVEAFESWRPQLIWMDWRMPVMDGLEATQRIRALAGGREVKIVVLSASVLEEEQAQVLAAGADDFLPKPIQFGEIFTCMTRHLGVRFVFEEPPAVAAESTEQLDRAALAALSSALRTELAEVLVSLDASRIAGTIRRVAESDPTLGGVLERRARQLQYTVILQALQSCQDGVQAEGSVA